MVTANQLRQLFESDLIEVDGNIISSWVTFDPEVEDNDIAVSFNIIPDEENPRSFDYNFRLGDLKSAELIDGHILNVNDANYFDANDCPLKICFYKMVPTVLE